MCLTYSFLATSPCAKRTEEVGLAVHRMCNTCNALHRATLRSCQLHLGSCFAAQGSTSEGSSRPPIRVTPAARGHRHTKKYWNQKKVEQFLCHIPSHLETITFSTIYFKIFSAQIWFQYFLKLDLQVQNIKKMSQLFQKI